MPYALCDFLVSGNPIPEYVLLGPVDILPDLVKELRNRFKPDFVSDPLFKIDISCKVQRFRHV